MSEIVLRYVGDGAYIVGIPACDMTQEMIDACGYSLETLLAFNNSGQPLYEAAGKE